MIMWKRSEKYSGTVEVLILRTVRVKGTVIILYNGETPNSKRVGTIAY
jgi:hypothetical protein